MVEIQIYSIPKIIPKPRIPKMHLKSKQSFEDSKSNESIGKFAQNEKKQQQLSISVWIFSMKIM